MKLKKMVSLGLATAMVLSVTACGGGSKSLDKETSSAAVGSSVEDVSTDGVTISILNTKSGMEKFFEPAFGEYKEKTGVTVEMSSISEGDSPYEAIQKRYAAGDAPTLAIMDCNDIVSLAEQKALPLDGEKWVADGGDKYGVKVNGTLYGFPFSLEGRGLLFNRTAIEKTLGKKFDEKSIQTLDDFKAICDELVAAGMEKPVCISKEDWSLGAHYLGLMYEEQDGTTKGADAFIQSIKDGSQKLIDNSRFNSLFDTFDVLMKYNINGDDPLAADYDMDNANFAEGDVAFWFNGNWVWEVVSGFADGDAEFGMMPVVQNTKDDEFNTLVNAVGSKQIMIDKSASPEQIQAAKDFLNWLVYDETAQDIIANQVMAVPCFNTFNASNENKLGQALKAYADANLTFDQYNGLPGDHWSTCGAFVQKYLAGKSDRAALAADLEEYWKSKK
ncbi:ABC transporter substrate-binding protein [Clostridium sp. E02]|uniref:ABC transporter substrate-binding protein n=1 Tax=Clostridium sp. E02 TaxID=2487134 RepID=UPI000F51E8BA|nr:ABC transporter substrate-binding protein [Clostridium sp. E02]